MKYGSEEEEKDEWAEDYQDSYLEAKKLAEEIQLQEMKNAGAIDQSYLATIVGNNSMKLFEQTLFFKEALEAQDYLQRNEK